MLDMSIAGINPRNTISSDTADTSDKILLATTTWRSVDVSVLVDAVAVSSMLVILVVVGLRRRRPKREMTVLVTEKLT